MDHIKMTVHGLKKTAASLGKILLVLSVSGLLPAAGCSAAPAEPKKADNRITQERKPAFLSIDDLEIPEEVFALLLREQKSFAVNRFLKEDQQMTEEFWNTPVDGTTPLDWCRQRAEEEATSLVELVLMARENSILEEADLAGLMDSRETENETRQKKQEQGEPVYGNSSFTPQTWIEYIQRALKQELQRVYEARTYSDAELQEIYDEDPSLFSDGTSAEVTLIYPGGESEILELSESETGKEETEKQELLARVLESEPGDVLENVSWNGETVTAVSGQKMEGTRDDFDSVKERLIPAAASRRLEEDLQERVKQAKIQRNEEAFAALEMS